MKLSEFASLNPWWRFGEGFPRYDRNLKELQEKFIVFERRYINIERGNIYVLRGTRQSGKTTYVKKTIQALIEKGTPPDSILYISCDRLRSRRELSNTILNFVRSRRERIPHFIFLDEITYLDGWNIEMKALADSNLMDDLVVVATGSSPARIKENAERLPGRRVEGNEFYFKPLTFREFVSQISERLSSYISSEEIRDALHILGERITERSITPDDEPEAIWEASNSIKGFKNELDFLFQIYLLTGGFPSTLNDYLKNRFERKEEEINGEVYETFIRIISGDISKLKRSERIAMEILRAVVERCGSRYSFSRLANLVETPHQTVIDYLDLLERSFILFTLYPLDISRRKPKFKGDKKIYPFDPFIYHSIIVGSFGMDFKEILDRAREKEGELVECLVAAHLLQSKEIPYTGEWRSYLWFLYTSGGKELDFLYKNGSGELLGIEVKYRESVSMRDITRVRGVKRYLVLTKDQLEMEGETLFVPVSLLLALLEKSERVI
jgi:hypothetical protein